MSNKVYVFGHQNPDTDSICAAISYSYLKNKIDSANEYIPVALKECNAETEYVLEQFDIQPPSVIKDLKPQVSDAKLSNLATAKEKYSIRKTLELLTIGNGRSLPVVDGNDRLIGIVSINDLIPMLLRPGASDLLKQTGTPFINMITDLQLQPATKRYQAEFSKGYLRKEAIIRGDIFISTDLNPGSEKGERTKQDIVVCNKNEWKSYADQVGGIIVGDLSQDQEIQDFIQAYDDYYKQCLLEQRPHPAYVYYSEMNIFQLAHAISQTVPISSIVMKQGLEYFVTYETIDDVKKNMLSSKHRTFPVVNENGYVQGMLSRADLVDIRKKKAILVDHNERGQSIEGIEDIQILEIIDHHRVADVSTIAPLYFRVEPVGCTCTIIAKMYQEHKIEIPKPIAGLMLSAILSDTLLFNSPTCTPRDKETALQLAEWAGLDYRYYGMKMLTSGSNLGGKTPIEIINMDRKIFMFGDYKVTIAQVNTGDFDSIYKILEQIIAEMERMCQQENFNLVVLLITDVVVGGTEIIPVGDARWIVEKAFDLKANEKSKFLSNVFSRKKQVVPKLMNSAEL